MEIGELMRKLGTMLGQTKPNALITLKQAVPIFAQLLSEVIGPEQGPGGPALAAPPPTPTEVPAPPMESAAPAGGYVPGM